MTLHNERSDVDEFLKANSVPGSQIFEPGGMESRLATEYGIISLPTMILIDPQGKVINRNIRTASELERQLEKVLAAKGYHYQFVFARNAGHVDRAVKQQTLPEALEYVWQGYAASAVKK